jgi:uncharacterized membrane protein YqjE
MDDSAAGIGQLVDTSKPLVKRLLIIGENRLELLMVELQAERGRMLRAIVLVAGMAVCGFLAVLALNVAIVVLLWNHSPAAVLLTLTCIYGAGAAGLYWRLTGLLRDWNMLSATLDQLRKDRECLEKKLA